MNRQVLIAGGAGFVGSHVVDVLIDQGDDVVCVDDLSTGVLGNVEHLSDCRSFRLVVGDVTDQSLVEGLRPPDAAGFDVVMNLASPASPPAYLARPIETLEVGSVGTRNLLELARRDDARFFLVSTSEVYGDPLVHPQHEGYWGNVNPVGERSVYDEAKRFAEALTMAYARVHGLEVRIARLFNTYGPRMRPDDGRVVTNLVHQAVAGEPLTVYGGGAQTRSFCHVDDEAAGILAVVDGQVEGPINIGNPHEVTILELVELVLELSGSSSTIEHRPLPADDPQLRRPDIELARRALGWTPRVDLRAGLSSMIEYCRAHPGA